MAAFGTTNEFISCSDANQEQSLRSTERLLEGLSVIPSALKIEELCDEDQRPLRQAVVEALQEEAKRKRHPSLVLQVAEAEGSWVVPWRPSCPPMGLLTSLDGNPDAQVDSLTGALDQLIQDKAALLWPQGAVLSQCRRWMHEKEPMTWRCRRVCRLNLPCFIKRPRLRPQAC